MTRSFIDWLKYEFPNELKKHWADFHVDRTHGINQRIVYETTKGQMTIHVRDEEKRIVSVGTSPNYDLYRELLKVVKEIDGEYQFVWVDKQDVILSATCGYIDFIRAFLPYGVELTWIRGAFHIHSGSSGIASTADGLAETFVSFKNGGVVLKRGDVIRNDGRKKTDKEWVERFFQTSEELKTTLARWSDYAQLVEKIVTYTREYLNRKKKGFLCEETMIYHSKTVSRIHFKENGVDDQLAIYVYWNVTDGEVFHKIVDVFDPKDFEKVWQKILPLVKRFERGVERVDRYGHRLRT